MIMASFYLPKIVFARISLSSAMFTIPISGEPPTFRFNGDAK